MKGLVRTLDYRSLVLYGFTTFATLICFGLCSSTETRKNAVLMAILMCGANIVSAAVPALAPMRNVSRATFFVIMLLLCADRLFLLASYTHATLVHSENDGDSLAGILLLVDLFVLITLQICVSMAFGGYEFWICRERPKRTEGPGVV